ncbi:hypothetical protein AK812_SmicGene48414, partial [Symbiodinium microadriaticum]
MRCLEMDLAELQKAMRPRRNGQLKGPNDRLQADLVDFSQNTRGPNKFGLVVTDVFTREAPLTSPELLREQLKPPG